MSDQLQLVLVALQHQPAPAQLFVQPPRRIFDRIERSAQDVAELDEVHRPVEREQDGFEGRRQGDSRISLRFDHAFAFTRISANGVGWTTLTSPILISSSNA